MKNKLRVNGLGALFATLLLWGAAAPESPVADAAMRRDGAAVRALLRQGADVNAAQGDGMTALHWAAENGDAELASVLLYAGANLEAATRLGDYKPLHLAARGARDSVVQVLVEAGADARARTTTGETTVLHFAASSGSVESIRSLVEHGADVNARETLWGQTPLMFAASRGRTVAVQALLGAGADPSVSSGVMDMTEQAAADRAAGQVRERVLKTFQGDRVAGGEGWLPSPAEVQAAVKAAQEVPQAMVQANMGLSIDVFSNPDTAAPSLVPRGAGDEYDPSYTSLVGEQGGMTALLHAVREGHAAAAMALVEGGADIDQPSAGDHTTPILMAAINGYHDLVLQLLERGADPNVASDAGTMPLFATLETFWAPKARYPQQQAYQQQVTSYMDVMKALLESGADPNARLTKHLWYMEYTFSQLGVDLRGATPFFRATYALDLPAMKLLLEYGADPTIATLKAPERRFRRGGGGGEDPSGVPPVPEGGPNMFPIHAATGQAYGTSFAGVSHRHAPDAWMPVLRFLVEELGADVNARDADAYSPLHNAASRGDTEMIRYLVEKGADVMAVSRRGQTTVDMANGPVQRVQPFPEAMSLLEGMGAANNHHCVSC